MTKKNFPNIITRIRTFAFALYNHVKTGMNKCSQRQINSRWKICQSCPMFTTEPAVKSYKGKAPAYCMVCGCALSKKKGFMNKLAWKDQKCPEGKW